MINANIYDKKLFVENLTVSDSVKFDTVKFTFPDNWHGYTKTALFKTESGETIKVVLDAANPLCLNENECYIPHEVIKAPCFYLSVFGVMGESVATTTQEKVVVLESGYAVGGEPSEPTPTEYQQIINLATETKEIAQSVRTDADNGLFKGEKGEKGDKGNIGPQGEKGDKGDPGKDGALTNLDQTYNPEGENAQSGKAVAEAIANKANLEAIVLFEPPTIESAIINAGYEFNPGKFYYSGKHEENGIIFDSFIDEKQAQPIHLKFTNEIPELFEGCLVEIEFDKNEQFNPVILNFIIYKDLSDKADIWEVKSLTNNSSSAIKNTLSGNCVRANDVSSLEHDLKIKLTSDVIIDFSEISVSRFGKNLFNQASTEVGTITVGFSNTTPRNLEHGKWYTNLAVSGYYDANRGVTISLNSDNVTVKANATNENTRLYGLSKALKCKPNTTYTLSYSMNNGVTKNASGIGFYGADKIHTSFVYCDSGNSFTTPDNCYWILVCFHGNSEATEVTYSDIQLELGNKATVYEPYTEPQTAIANADGTVKGLTSISPNMTLLTDTDDANINLTYNADTKAYIDSKFAELAAVLNN